MVTEIYVDILFLENFFIDIFVLYITAFILSKKLNLMRGILSGTIGALYVVVTYVWSGNIILSILILFCMMFTAFKSIKPKYLLTYVSVNFILAGGIYFIKDIVNEKYKESVSFILGIIIGIVFIYILGREFFMIFKNGLIKKELTGDMTLYYMGKTVKLKVFSDTGNSLIDPISRKSVVVISKSKARELADIKSYSKMKNFRLIPCMTASGHYDTLYGFKPDKLIYENNELDVVTAISKEDFSDYDAIINPLTLV